MQNSVYAASLLNPLDVGIPMDARSSRIAQCRSHQTLAPCCRAILAVAVTCEVMTEAQRSQSFVRAIYPSGLSTASSFAG